MSERPHIWTKVGYLTLPIAVAFVEQYHEAIPEAMF